MPSYGATLKAMRALSEHEAAVTLEHGSRADTLDVIRLDNVQNYLIQRDPGIGRENKLNIGLAATYYEVDGEEIDIAVFDLDDKQCFLAEGKHRDLTVQKRLTMLTLSRSVLFNGLIPFSNTSHISLISNPISLTCNIHGLPKFDLKPSQQRSTPLHQAVEVKPS